LHDVEHELAQAIVIPLCEEVVDECGQLDARQALV
jgi:hypothetical protein